MARDDIRATVQKVIVEGRHGPYAVARTDDNRNLNMTFSLNPDTWEEESFPEPGEFVILSNVIKKRAGWRAKSVRFVRPTDDETAISRSNET